LSQAPYQPFAATQQIFENENFLVIPKQRERYYRFADVIVVETAEVQRSFFRILGPKLFKILGLNERGGATEKIVKAFMPTFIYELTVGPHHKKVSTQTEINSIFGSCAERTKGLLGDRAFIVPPVTINHNPETEITSISFYYECWNAEGKLQYPHTYRRNTNT